MTDIKIEEKWQKKWQESKLFESNPSEKEKIFLTVAYPYPSGAMHVGHVKFLSVGPSFSKYAGFLYI